MAVAHSSNISSSDCSNSFNHNVISTSHGSRSINGCISLSTRTILVVVVAVVIFQPRVAGTVSHYHVTSKPECVWRDKEKFLEQSLLSYR